MFSTIYSVPKARSSELWFLKQVGPKVTSKKVKSNPNRYYHAMCHKCGWQRINTTEKLANEKGLAHYYESPEEDHYVKFFDSLAPLASSNVQ